MHGFHADKMGVPAVAALGTPCYAATPAPSQVPPRQDGAGRLHLHQRRLHGDMAQVADSQGAPTNREAWLQEPSVRRLPRRDATPRTPAQLYRNSYLANGPEDMNGKLIQCESCHGSPHAEWRSTKSIDNQVPLQLQGAATFIKRCSACHGDASGRIIT